MTDLPEGHSKTLLVGFINRVKALEDEIAELRADQSDVCKEAKSAGFDATKIRETVRWLRRIDKHGRDKIDEAEAIFDLYRQVVDGRAANFESMMNDARDRALLARFAADDQVAAKVNQRTKASRTAVALARAAKQARAG
jgi:uncharacterized protein (UPF0335 family)